MGEVPVEEVGRHVGEEVPEGKSLGRRESRKMAVEEVADPCA